MEHKSWSQALLFLLSLSGAVWVHSFYADSGVPEVRERVWGPAGSSEVMSPFELKAGAEVLADLRRRLQMESSRWVAGTSMANLTEYWLKAYDWPKRERILNQYPHYRTNVMGLQVHFQRIRLEGQEGMYNKTRPLLLIHGWPSSFAEFQKVIPSLVQPKDSDINFELIIPSIPGFGFSEAPDQPGLGPVEMTQVLLKLMSRLGHKKFYVHGSGRWGSRIATHMAVLYYRNVVGIHLSNCYSEHPRAYLRYTVGSRLPYLYFDSEEAEQLKQYYSNPTISESAAMKPETLGFALSSSPSGLAAFLLEKSLLWSSRMDQNPGTGGLSTFDLDTLLDNVMIYWITSSIASSSRILAEQSSESQRAYKMESVSTHVPTSCTYFPEDVFRQPQPVLHDKYTQILRFTKMEAGGHFPGLQVPGPLAQDILTSFAHLEAEGLADYERKHTCKVGGLN